MKKLVFVITGNSGVGKTSVAKTLLRKNKKMERAVTCTTRKKRPNEKDGKDYYFLSKKRFKTMLKNKGFFEWDFHYGNYYGNSKKELERIWQQGKTALIITDINGAITINKKIKNCISIFIKPDKLSNLEKRILKREKISKEDLKTRLERIRQELKLAKKCDYRVINSEGKMSVCVNRIEKIINKHLKLTKIS